MGVEMIRKDGDCQDITLTSSGNIEDSRGQILGTISSEAAMKAATALAARQKEPGHPVGLQDASEIILSHTPENQKPSLQEKLNNISAGKGCAM